jgi:hypothetical protein
MAVPKKSSAKIESLVSTLTERMLGHALLGAFKPKRDSRSHLKFCKYHDDLQAGRLDYSRLISLVSDGDLDAHDVLRTAARKHLKLLSRKPEFPIPPQLLSFIDSELKQKRAAPRKRGGGKKIYFDRDSYIVEMIAWVSRQGLSPTVNPATNDISACAVAAKALVRLGVQATESSIAAIWRQRKIVEEALLQPGESFESALPPTRGRRTRSKCNKEIQDSFGSLDDA